MRPVFYEGQTVEIRPFTFHNTYEEPQQVTFVRYMAGDEYAIVSGYGGAHLRVNVDDLVG